MSKSSQRLPLICAFAGAIVFNLAGYVVESRLLSDTTLAFKGIAGLVVGYAVGYMISRIGSGATK